MMMLWVLFLTSRNDEKRAWVGEPEYAGRTMRREGKVAGRVLETCGDIAHTMGHE